MYKYVHHSVFIDLKLTMVYKTTAINSKVYKVVSSAIQTN